MQVVELPKKTIPATLEEAMEVVDSLRAKLLSGEIKAFLGVGVGPEHDTFMFSCSPQKTTKLEMLGAITHLQQSFMAEN